MAEYWAARSVEKMAMYSAECWVDAMVVLTGANWAVCSAGMMAAS